MKLVFSGAFGLFLLFGTALSNHVKETGDKGDSNSIGRLRSLVTKNLRTASSMDKADATQDLPNENFQEDEVLWERILQQDLSLTFPPTPPPITQEFTLMPTSLPIMAEDEECELMATVECVVVDGDSRIPCDQVPKPSDEVECVKDVEYVYKVTNSCDPSINPNCDSAAIRMFDIVRNGNLKSLMSLVPQNSRIDPADSEFFIESGIEIDFCMSQNVDTSVRIVADTAPGMQVGICSAQTSNFFTIGFVPDIPCKVAVDLSCFIMVDGERVNCKDVPMPEDDTECVKDVNYVTLITNIGDVSKTILSLDRTRDGESADLLGLLEKRDLAPGEFTFAREEGLKLDFCVQRLVTTTIDVTSEAFGVGQLECSEQVTLVFSIAITCDVDVSVQCFADASGGFTLPCSDFNPFVSSTNTMVGCEHVHKYIYTIENTGPGEEVVEGVVVTRDGVTNNILDRRFNLDPDETREVNEFVLVDYCKQYPNGISTDVEVTADMVPLGGSCVANDQITVFPPMEDCNVILNPLIKCTVSAPDGREVPCRLYHELIKEIGSSEQCQREATLRYTLVNEGLACLFIYSVTGEIDNEGSFDLTPPNGKNLCPKEVLTLEQTQIEDFCDDDFEDRVVVTVNDGPPETCGGFGVIGFFPPKEELECIIELELDCTTTTGENCKIISQELKKTKCDIQPCYIDLTFTGGLCGNSQNYQDYSFMCHENGDISGLSSAFVTVHSYHGAEYFADNVNLEETFRIGSEYKKLDDGVIVRSYDRKGGSLIQTVKFLTSCLKPLYTDDIFGAFTVAGFGNKEHNISSEKLSEGTLAEFLFSYKVRNIGKVQAILDEVRFTTDVLDLGSIDLSGSTIENGLTFDDVESLDLSQVAASTSVFAVAVAKSVSGQECTARAEVPVEFTRPVPSLVQVKCLDNPKSYFFQFLGGACTESKNAQDIYCTDKGQIQNGAHIVITDGYSKHTYFDQKVEHGEVFEVDAGRTCFKSYIIVKIKHYNDVVQQIKFDASCDQKVYLGDIFGSLMVVGWNNQKQGLVEL